MFRSVAQRMRRLPRLHLLTLGRVFAAIAAVVTAADLARADLVYVSLHNGSVVTFDTSLSTAAAIEASKQDFATGLIDAYGLAFDAAGNLYVANRSDDGQGTFGAVDVYYPDGSHLRQITAGLGDAGPWGVALDAASNLYVSTNNTNEVHVFNSSGSPTATWANDADNYLQFPYGVITNTAGNVLVAVAGGTVNKFASDGTYVASIGSGLDSPVGLAFDATGNLYVSNAGNPNTGTTISKFDPAGNPIGAITTNLAGPWGIAFDSTGNLYAANNGDNTISKFDASGNFVISWNVGGVPQYLAVEPVPEPAGLAAAVVGLGALVSFLRRRHFLVTAVGDGGTCSTI